MPYFVAGNTLLRLQIKDNSVTSCMWWWGEVLKQELIFLVHKLSHAAFMQTLWVSVKEQYLQKKIHTLWVSYTRIRTVT